MTEPPSSGREETPTLPATAPGENAPAAPTGEYASLAMLDPQATQGFAPLPQPGPLPQIPGYEILGELGRGGMGVVFKARQEKVNRIVALKMVLAGHLASPESRLRFLLEGEVLGRLQHPHIVQIYEVGTFENQPYFALEYVDGGSLADLLKERQSFSPTDAATWTETLARAVHYAHSNGVIHRDLKPANVLLSFSRAPEARASGARLNEAVPKITDFGLAKQTDIGTGLTASGALMGTPAYMSPEQAEGKGKLITTATDVYALGAILYEMLTGRPPFVANTPFDVIVKVVSEEPPALSSLRERLPKDLVTICHKCLQKEPGKRYATAEALADDLRRFLEDKPIQARAVTPTERFWRWCRRNRMVAGLSATIVLVLLVGIVVVSWLWRRAEDRADAEALAKQAAKDAQRHADEEKAAAQFARSVSIQQRKRAEEEQKRANAERNTARHLLGLHATREGLRLADQGDFFNAFLWFTESLKRDPENAEAIAAARERLAAYRQYAPRPTLVHVLDRQKGVSHSAVSPDGRWIVTAGRDDGTVYVWEVSTGQPRFPPLAHAHDLVDAAFSPDGRWIVTSCGDWLRKQGEARVWDAATGQPRTPPMRHQNHVLRAAFSPDGRWIITASSDMTARVWDAATGQPRTPPLRHENSVRCAAFSPDGRWVVTASTDQTARVWDAATGQPHTPPLRHPLGLNQALFSPDGRYILTACGNFQSNHGEACIWNAATGQLQTSPLVHPRAITLAAYSPDGRWIVTASQDGTARVWNAATGQPRTPSLFHRDSVTCAAFSPDGRWVITGSRDRTARVWDAATGHPLTPPLPHHVDVKHAAFSPDGRWVVTASDLWESKHGDVRVWDMAMGQKSIQPVSNPKLTAPATFSPDSQWVVTGDWNLRTGPRTAQVWDAATGQPRTPPFLHQDRVWSAAFSPDGRWVVTASADHTARVWDAATGQPRTPPLRHQDIVRTAAFSPDGRWVVTASYDKTARIWDAATGQPRTPPLVHQGGVWHTAFSPDSRYIVTGSDDKTARVWDAVTGQPRTPPLVHQSIVWYTAFSPDGRWLVTASQDMTARIWGVETGQPRTSPLVHHGDVHLAAFSPDSHWVVTVSGDQAARVWDAATGQPRTPLLRHQGIVRSAAFSPDGKWIVTASEDKTVRVWDAATGLALAPPLVHPHSLWHAAVSADGQYIVTITIGETFSRGWQLPKEARPQADLVLLAQLFSGHAVDETGGLTPLSPPVFQRAWQQLRTKYPDDFRVAPTVARQWRLEQIADCLKNGNLPGAFLHRDWMIVEAIREQQPAGK